MCFQQQAPRLAKYPIWRWMGRNYVRADPLHDFWLGDLVSNASTQPPKYFYRV